MHPLMKRARRLCAPAVAALLLSAAANAQGVSPRQLVEVADLGELAVSPDGSRVAFRLQQPSVERNTHDTTWYVQPLDASAPARRVGEGGQPLRESDGASLAPAGVTWSPDGRFLYYRALLDGHVAVWRARADGSGARAVTRDAADVRGFRLAADGHSLHYRVGATRQQVRDAEQAEYDNGIHIDATVALGQPLYRSGRLDGRAATQRLHGGDVIRSPLLAGVADRWRALDLATGNTREVSGGAAPPVSPAHARVAPFKAWKLAWDAHAARVAMLVHVTEWQGVGPRPEVALSVLAAGKGARPVQCRDALCTGKPITAIQWRPGHDEVLFTVTDADDSQAQSIFRWNVASGRVLPVVRTSGLMNGGRGVPGTCAASAAALVCVAADARHPPRLERVDLDSGDRRVLFDPNAALAADMASVPVQRLHWQDAAGRRFNGLYFPARRAAGEPAPLFLTYYRCSGFVRGGVGDEWPLATLAGHGISALCINAPPSVLDAVTRFEIGRSAIESAIALLSSRGEIEPGNVGMGGLSYGTEVTLWMAMHSHTVSAASVSSIAFSPLAYTLMSLSGEPFFSRLRTYWQLGDPAATPAQWKRLSPAFNLDRIHIPVLMQLPEQEYLHTLDYAVPLIRDRRADLYVYPNEAHQKFQPRHKLAVYERNLDWFRFWLQGFEDPQPAKAGQYARWRMMADRRGAASPGQAPD